MNVVQNGQHRTNNLTKVIFKEIVTVLLSNYIFKLEIKVFKQAIEISKGSDPVAFLRKTFSNIIRTNGLMNFKNEHYKCKALW